MGLVVKKKKQEIIARDVTNNDCDGYPFGSFLGNFMDFRRFYGPVKWEMYARDSPINGSPVIYSQTMGFRVNIYINIMSVTYEPNMQDTHIESI